MRWNANPQLVQQAKEFYLASGQPDSPLGLTITPKTSNERLSSVGFPGDDIPGRDLTIDGKPGNNTASDRRVSELVRRLIRNQLPRKGLRVRVPCPPLS